MSRSDLADMTPAVLPLTPAPADRLGQTFRCQGLTQLKGPIVCTVHTANGTVVAATVVPDSTTTSTTTTLPGLAPGSSPPGSVEFNLVVTLATPVHGPATVVVGPPKAEYGVPLATVAVAFA